MKKLLALPVVDSGAAPSLHHGIGGTADRRQSSMALIRCRPLPNAICYRLPSQAPRQAPPAPLKGISTGGMGASTTCPVGNFTIDSRWIRV
jgi:hypothetical protein